MSDSIPFANVFVIIPAHTLPIPMRWQVVVVRGGYFGFAPCSSRETPEECLADIARLTKRYTECEYIRALDNFNDGVGVEVSTTFKAHVKEMLNNDLNVLEQDIEDVIVFAKRPKVVLGTKKFKPRIKIDNMDWLYK